MAGIPVSVKVNGILLIIFAILSAVLNYLLISGSANTGTLGIIINGYNFSSVPIVGNFTLPTFSFCPLPSIANYTGFVTIPMALLGVLSLFLGNPKSNLVKFFIILGAILGIVLPPMSAILSILYILCDLKIRLIYPLKIGITISSIIQLSSVLNMLCKTYSARKNAPKETKPIESPANAKLISPVETKLANPQTASQVPPAAPLVTIPKEEVTKVNAGPYKMNYYPLINAQPHTPTTPYLAYQVEPRYAPSSLETKNQMEPTIYFLNPINILLPSPQRYQNNYNTAPPETPAYAPFRSPPPLYDSQTVNHSSVIKLPVNSVPHVSTLPFTGAPNLRYTPCAQSSINYYRFY